LVERLALEVQHRVHQMLEHARPSERAFLGDVADQERREPPALRLRHEARAALTHLGDRARRRFKIRQEDRLDRVDDQRLRLDVVERRLDGVEVGLRPEQQAIAGDAEPIGPQLHLRR
jgi:hypothetical protein